MNQINSIDIKEKFLNFFESKKHLKISDSSIIPKNDPTLLFINSGMAPLKRFFTGEETPPSKRLCNVQPCIRTIDIDEVGDKHHLTSFQMLGSWSIGDYFKENAIKLAFEFLTQHINIPTEKLYVTIFGGDKELGLEEDEEARKYWIEAGINPEHVIPCPKEDNFWGPTSETGPCGPCTEVFYDTGDKNGSEYKPGSNFDTKKRYIEIWNAGVFMQFNKNQDGSYSKLKFKSVDTGAGLERLAMVLNNKDSVYDTDLLLPIKNKIIELLPKEHSISQREILIMTDHLRTACLILSEKVKPSNEGRGYIPRKLIRKCILITTKAKINNFNFTDLLEFILDEYKNIFNNFEINKNYILEVFKKEYEQFIKIIVTGLDRLEKIQSESSNISADELFSLVTTFGLPFDIIKDYAHENNLSLEEDEFNKKLLEHKNISKNNQNSKNNVQQIDLEFLRDLPATKFEGYEKLKTSAKILKLINKNNQIVNHANNGDEIILVLDHTTFYAESGGQCADKGIIHNDDFVADIYDVQKTSNGIFLHFAKITNGEINLLKPLSQVFTEVDSQIRQSTANNHTAVHLLHAALRGIYGQELHQAGSKVEAEKFRFDFNYDDKISTEDNFKIEKIVNDYIRADLKLSIENKSLEEAVKEGAMALFENKYSDFVRVVSIGDVSKELCGGTHTTSTGSLGLFLILSVESIGKGIKRITGITGAKAIEYIQEQNLLIKNISQTLGVKSEKILDKITELKSTNNNNHKKNANSNSLSYNVNKTPSGLQYVFISHEDFDKSLRDNIIEISDKINGLAIYLGGKTQKQIIVSTSKNSQNKLSAKNILSIILANSSGKGGGSDRIASGGGVTANDETIISIINNL